MPPAANGGSDDEHNPFVAFKRQIDSVLQNFGGADTFFGTLENEIQAAFKKFGDSYERATNPERRQLDGREEVGSRPRRRSPDEEHRPSGPRMDRHSEGDLERYRKIKEQHPWFSIPFLYDSVYSPRSLEHEDHQNCVQPEQQMNWRGAFCDLMASATRMDDQWREELMEPVMSGKRESATDGDNHSFGFVLPEDSDGTRKGRMVFPFPPRTMNEVDKFQLVREIGYDFRRRERLEQILNRMLPELESETELDMYEHVVRSTDATNEYENFLRAIGHGDKAIPQQQLAEAATSSNPESKPSIVATLTRVQSFTRYDGSVETHRVLRKRFADGREEVDDHTEVTPAPAKHEKLEPEKCTGRVMQELRRHDQPAKKKSGWFWSSP